MMSFANNYHTGRTSVISCLYLMCTLYSIYPPTSAVLPNTMISTSKQEQDTGCVPANIQLTTNPSQPRQQVLFDLSIFSIKTDYTPETHESVISCLSNHTSTSNSSWGTRSLSCFAPRTLQIELFVSVSEAMSLTITRLTDEYIREDELTNCVRESGNLDENGKLIAGRTIIASDVNGIISSGGGAPGWLVGVLLLVLLIVGCVILIVVACSKSRSYQADEYGNMENGWAFDEMDAEEGRELERVQIEQDLQLIAGQRGVTDS